mgnify:CR=1 FL=1
MKKYSKIIALGIGIMILILSLRQDLFVDNEEIEYYIFLVVGITAIIGFIGGMIYLIVVDYINYKMRKDED